VLVHLILVTLLLSLKVVASQPPVFQAHAGQKTVQKGQPSANSGDDGEMANHGTREEQGSNQQNQFLEYYPRQGQPLFLDNMDFCFLSNEQKIVKRQINGSLTEKAIVIFWGEWCPHCETCLKTFSPYFEILRLAGIKTIFVHVPTMEVLKNWRDPTVDDFNEAKNKLTSCGVTLVDNWVFLTMIGDKSVLSGCAVTSLPVMIAIKDNREVCRVVGVNAVQKINLSNPDTFRKFLGIWPPAEAVSASPDTGESSQKSSSEPRFQSPSKKPRFDTIRQKFRRDVPTKTSTKVNLGKASECTRRLNLSGSWM
jgi:thiol-disulfide isomerase/thioredoxin